MRDLAGYPVPLQQSIQVTKHCLKACYPEMSDSALELIDSLALMAYQEGRLRKTEESRTERILNQSARQKENYF